MSDQSVRVNLSFSADTQQAKQQLMDLKNTLSELGNLKFTGANSISGITQETVKASQAAAQLKLSLESATNVNTGKLNLTKFSQEMDKSKMSFEKYRDALLELGPEGARAFSQLTDSVLTADSAIGVGSKKLNDFFKTLKNTAKWQISSNIMHGFEGALKNAYGYAQDLNESLNDIRIVTGYNVDKMAKFAETANRAAKELSSSTLEYTNASLIYYQQGLDESAVNERTKITVNMANATGESAQQVSDYMTAVWNNFDDGSKSLEYYADVMTALGAATASSTDEIATGLEKFAAISETVGLSYEYATAALATVTAETRQSADVVGTSFKTIFSRMEGLSLGETLDDGTTLNQYSEALAKVGVDIKDANGNLKDMDNILSEMADVWETLSRDEQVALAQKVAGVRQYNNLMSLMSNWDKMEINLGVAADAEGTLQEQADIYAESWEAASKRVEAAAQGIYDSLINDDFFIDLLNGFEKLLSFVDAAIDGLGGMKGVLTMVVAVATKLFSGQIASSMNSMKDNLQSMTKAGKQKVEARREQALNAASTMNTGMANEEGAATNTVYQERAKLQKVLLDNAENMTEEELKLHQALLDNNKALGERAIENAKNLDNANSSLGEESQRMRTRIENSDVEGKDSSQKSEDLTSLDKSITLHGQYGKQLGKNKIALNQVKKAQELLKTSQKQHNEAVKKGIDTTKQDAEAAKKQQVAYKNVAKDLKNLKSTIEEGGQAFDSTRVDTWVDALENGTITSKELKDAQAYLENGINLNIGAMTQEEESVRKLLQGYQVSESTIDSYIAKMRALVDAGYSADEALELLGLQNEELAAKFNNAGNKAMDFGTKLTTFTNVWSSIQMISNSLQGMMDAIADPDATGLEKIESIFTSLISIVPAATMAYQSFDKIRKASIVTDGAKATSEKLVSTATDGSTVSINLNAAALKAHPIMWVITAIMAAVSVISLVSGAIEANSQRIQENADASRDAADAAREEYDAISESADAYEKQLQAYKDGTASKSELRQAAIDLAKAYEDENLLILAQTGQYEELAKKIEEARIAKLKAAKDSSDQSKEDNEEAFKDSMRKGKGMLSGGQYQVSMSTNYQKDAGVKQAISKDQDLDYLSYDQNTATVSIIADEEDMADAYKEVQDFVANLKKTMSAEELDASPLYKELTEWLGKAKEDYDNFANAATESLQLDIDLAYSDSESGGFGKEIEAAANLEQYQAAREKLIQAVASSQGITEDNAEAWKNLELQVSSYLSGIESISEFEGMNNWLDNLKETYGDAAPTIKEFFDEVPEEDKKLVSQIDFDVYSSKEAMQIALDALKAEAETENVEVQLTTVRSAQETLAEGPMSSQEDFDAMENSGIDWGNEEQGIMEFSDFVRMTYAEQVDYLDGLERKYSDSTIEMAKSSVEKSKSELDAAVSVVSDLGGKLEDAKAKLKADPDNDGLKEQVAQLEAQIEDAKSRASGLVDEIQDKELELELQIKLEGEERINDLLGDISNMKAINDDLRDSVSQVGNSYVLTAEQAQEWANVYPELLSNAEVTAEGMVQLNASEVDNFIAGKEAEMIASGESEIAILEMKKAALEAEKAKVQAEVDLAIAAATAKTETEKEAALMKLEYGNALTEALIANDIDATTSNQLAAAAMAGNQEEYARIAMEAATDTSGNFNQAAYDSAMAVYDAMQSGSQNVDEFRQTCADAAQQFAAIGEGTVTGGGDAVTGPTFKGGYTGEYTAGSGQFSGSEFEYEGQTMTLDDFIAGKTLNLSGLDASIGTINTTIAQIRDGMAKGLETYTPETARPSDSSGSDSGSDSGSEKDDKNLEEIAERYHEINKSIETQEHLLNKLSKVKERAQGPAKVKAIFQEQKALEQLYKDQEDLYALQLGFLKLDEEKAKNLGAQFDDQGNISNYTALVEGALAELQAAYDAYNNSEKTDEDEDALDKAEEAYNDLIATLEQYEETLDGVRASEEELLDLQNQMDAAASEAITFVVEIQTEAAQAQLDYLAYLLEKMEYSGYDAAKAIALMGSQVEELGEMAAAAQTGIDRLFEKNKGKDITEWSDADLASLQEYRDQLLSVNQELMATRQAVEDTLMQAFDDWREGYQEQIAQFDHYDAVFESYANITDLMGKSSGATKEEKQRYNQERADNATRKLDASKTYYDEVGEKVKSGQSELAAAESRLANAEEGSAEYEAAQKDIETWKKYLKEAQDELASAEEAYLADWEAALQAGKDAFIANAKLEIQALEEQIAGTYGTIEEMQATFDRNSEVSDRYLEGYEKMYELNKLNRDLESQIDNTSNIKAKEKLLKIQEKINQYQAEGIEMSQYDLDYLQKEYELEMAKIAMEEAQNAKSQVRMVKDAEGNFSYTYTADEDASADAAQNYEDKLYEMTELNNKYVEEQTASMLSAQQEMLDALNALSEQAAAEMWTEEELAAKAAETQAYYTSLVSYYGSEIDKASLNNTVIYAREYETYAGYVGETMTEMQKLEAAQKALMVEQQADVERLRIQQQAANDHLTYLYESDQISAEEYMARKAETNKVYVNQITTEAVEAETLSKEALQVLRDNDLISQQEYETQRAEVIVANNSHIALANIEARDEELAAAQAAYEAGILSEEEYKAKKKAINKNYNDEIEAATKIANETEQQYLGEQYAVRMAELEAAKQAEKEKLMAAYQERLAQIEKAREDEKAARTKAFEEELAQLEKAKEEEKAKRKAVLDAELAELEKAKQKEIDAINKDFDKKQKALDEAKKKEEERINKSYSDKQKALDDAQKKEQDKLKAAYERGEISEEEYQKGLKKINEDYKKKSKDLKEAQKKELEKVDADYKTKSEAIELERTKAVTKVEKDYQTKEKAAKKEYKKDIKAIDEDYATKSKAAEKQYKKDMKDIDDKYDKEAKNAKKQLDKDIKDLDKQFSSDSKKALEGRTKTTQTETAKQNAANSGVAKGLSSMLPGLKTSYSNASGYASSFSTAVQKAVGSSDGKGGGILGSYSALKKNTENAMSAAGTSVDNFAKDMKKALVGSDGKGGVAQQSKKTDQAIQDMANTTKDDLDKAVDAVSDWQKTWGVKAEQVIQDNEDTIETINGIVKEIAKLSDEEYDIQYKYKTVGSAPKGDSDKNYKITYTYETKGKPPSDDGGDDTATSKPKWDRVVAAYDKINGGAWGNGMDNRIKAGKKDGFTEAEVRAGQDLINYTYPTYLNGQGKTREQAKKLMGYDTGGYTGEWGSEGKLALLHEKEIVLNASDTQNMLSAVSMIRDIAKMIDIQAYQSQFAQLASPASGYSNYNSNQENLEQYVEIRAEFPSATNHSEIEEAFNNIINLASQYANRK